jgi:hypothetical protein
MALRISDFEPAAAIGQEFNALAAGPGDVDDTIADQGAAIDHGAACDLDQAAGGACEQHAAICDGAAHDDRAAAQRLKVTRWLARLGWLSHSQKLTDCQQLTRQASMPPQAFVSARVH